MIEYTGVRQDPDMLDILQEVYQGAGIEGDYFLTIRRSGVVIDATYTGSIARFANHCCEPNCKFEEFQLMDSEYDVVFIVATRDIKAGEELLVDYGFVYSKKDTIVICNCSAMTCKGFIGTVDEVLN